MIVALVHTCGRDALGLFVSRFFTSASGRPRASRLSALKPVCPASPLATRACSTLRNSSISSMDTRSYTPYVRRDASAQQLRVR